MSAIGLDQICATLQTQHGSRKSWVGDDCSHLMKLSAKLCIGIKLMNSGGEIYSESRGLLSSLSDNRADAGCKKLFIFLYLFCGRKNSHRSCVSCVAKTRIFFYISEKFCQFLCHRLQVKWVHNIPRSSTHNCFSCPADTRCDNRLTTRHCLEI